MGESAYLRLMKFETQLCKDLFFLRRAKGPIHLMTLSVSVGGPGLSQISRSLAFLNSLWAKMQTCYGFGTGLPNEEAKNRRRTYETEHSPQ